MAKKSFPIYMLWLDDAWKVVFPKNHADIGHTEFWEQTVSHIVAQHFGIPQKKLDNLPYCQRRARVVGNTVYYGGRPDPTLLKAIRGALDSRSFFFTFDDHEKRLRADVAEFRQLVQRYGEKS